VRKTLPLLIPRIERNNMTFAKRVGNRWKKHNCLREKKLEKTACTTSKRLHAGALRKRTNAKKMKPRKIEGCLNRGGKRPGGMQKSPPLKTGKK